MPEEALKKLIKSYPELKAKREILDEIRKYSQNDDDKEYLLLAVKIQVIESALEILTKYEKKIILLHLVDNIKWSDVELICEQQVGTELNYSERTFLRIQKNALKKMEEFILKNKFEEYLY